MSLINTYNDASIRGWIGGQGGYSGYRPIGIFPIQLQTAREIEISDDGQFVAVSVVDFPRNTIKIYETVDRVWQTNINPYVTLDHDGLALKFLPNNNLVFNQNYRLNYDDTSVVEYEKQPANDPRLSNFVFKNAAAPRNTGLPYPIETNFDLNTKYAYNLTSNTNIGFSFIQSVETTGNDPEINIFDIYVVSGQWVAGLASSINIDNAILSSNEGQLYYAPNGLTFAYQTTFEVPNTNPPQTQQRIYKYKRTSVDNTTWTLDNIWYDTPTSNQIVFTTFWAKEDNNLSVYLIQPTSGSNLEIWELNTTTNQYERKLVTRLRSAVAAISSAANTISIRFSQDYIIVYKKIGNDWIETALIKDLQNRVGAITYITGMAITPNGKTIAITYYQGSANQTYYLRVYQQP